MKITRLAMEEGEFDTDVLLRVGDKYCLRHENGGSRGSRQINGRFPATVDDDEWLTPEEAAAAAMRMGADDDVVESIG